MNFLDYTMRGGSSPNPRTEMIELQIADAALKSYLVNPLFQQKGLKWTYNWFHFLTFYSTSDPEILKYLHEVRPYPDYIEVETTTYCNMNCKMCENTYWDEKPEHMSLENFKFILDQFPKLKWIGVTGIGQSFLNPDFMKMVKLCKDREIYIEMYDNFRFLDYKKSKKMVKWGLDKIYVSIDAATEETYKKVRPGSDWNIVMKNIKDMDRAKKEKNSYYPELWFHFIVSKDNIDEMEKYLEMINDLNVDVKQIQFSRCLHKFKEIADQFVDIPDETKNKIIEKGKDCGLRVSWNVDAPDYKPPMDRCSVWIMPFIFVDGTVIPCCSLNEQNDRPWQRETSLGNIFKTPFREIWYGNKYTKMLKGIREGKCPKECARCVIYENKKSINSTS